MTRRRNRPAVNWPLLRAIVVSRDAAAIIRATQHREPSEAELVRAVFTGRLPVVGGPVCIAPLVDKNASSSECWGRTTLDHVKPDPRMGVKAEDIPEQLVSACQGHTEDGMKAGHQWNTAHREEERDYLRRAHP